ncbi:hypothetical protein D3C87_1574260 [compost metagenome]|jgi:hypothetical protein
MAKNWITDHTASKHYLERRLAVRLRNAAQTLRKFGEPNALSVIIRQGAPARTGEV